MTPLHYAARKQSKALMDLLTQYGANEYVRDKKGYTAYSIYELCKVGTYWLVYG